MGLTATKVYAMLNSKINSVTDKIKNPIVYKGSVATADLLPASPSIGDMYDIQQESIYGGAGMNVVWNGTSWDAFGSFLEINQEQIIQIIEQYFTDNPISEVPTGGTAGQVLTKDSGTDGDASWQDLPEEEIPSYNDLPNKPSLNGVTLEGELSFSDVGISNVPAGGTQGQVLTKNSTTDGDASWSDLPEPETPSYTDITNKPKINSVEVSGNKSFSDYGLVEIPTGGTAGQVLTKSSATDGDIAWGDIPEPDAPSYTDITDKPKLNGVILQGNKSLSDVGITSVPTGGTTGQVLAKKSNTNGDIEWQTPSSGGSSSYSDLTNKPSLNGVTLEGNKSFEDIGLNPSDMAPKYLDHGTSDTTFSLSPLTYHKWDTVTNLNLSLSSPTSGIVNEYMFTFTSGQTPTRLSLPSTIQTDMVVEPNMRYECSIIDNYMVHREWEVEA